MKAKQYEFKTLSQIADAVTDENVSDLAQCLVQWLFHYNIVIGEIKSKNKDLEHMLNSEIAEPTLIWTDDGINEVTGIIVRNKDSGEVFREDFDKI